MFQSHRSRIPLLLLSLTVLVPHARADVKMPSIFGNHMVLQREIAVPVWGTAAPSEEITVEFAGKKVTTKADDKGKWKVTLPAMKAESKPQTLTVTGQNKLTFTDVLVGEVWIGSGQSNMEWSVRSSMKPKETIEAAKHPNIRLFHIPRVKTKTPASDVKASWNACTPKTIPNFSAVLYFFGVEIQKELNVPIGLINSSWGGSPIEPWTVTAKGSGEMYNGMIAPIQPFGIRGVLWYQGESNVGNGLAYGKKMEALITGWRKIWGSEIPFYYVQIAPWSRYGPGLLPKLWEAQVATLKIPGTGMAVVTDLVDDINDIHPKNKLDVGKRLALWAMAKTYGKKDIVYSGPLYTGMKVDGTKAVLSFAHIGGGLKSRDDKPLTGFEIAGEDGKFVPAEAKIDGETVVVTAKDVSKPTQVRFGWNKTANPNLMNKEGLPASPFQTKDWTGGTGK